MKLHEKSQLNCTKEMKMLIFFLIVFIATAYDPVAFAASAASASRQNFRTICSVIGITILITLILVQFGYSGDNFE